MDNTTFYVKEATNEECIRTLETILSGIDGVDRALVDVEDGEVKIDFHSSQVTLDELKAKISQHGLHVRE
ncbi:heavy-metal-associated domain-containing protein [Bacillus seohaeanensis]|uniref:Heavy-metal-associated domain-containing protein n=1 Tax=Bacillus seohaeanensis TaxID=284580 RepID=A0ABW5RU09_9BACI